MSLESGKSIGSIGALLLVIGSFVPFLSIVGIILLLVGMKNLADYYHDNNIFQNALYGLIFYIIGAIAAGFSLVSLFFGGIAFGIGGLVGFFLVLVVAFIFYILGAIYYRKAFDILAQKTGEGNFRTAGLLLFIGAILTIVIVGLVLLFIAWIFATIAFFSMKSGPTQPPAGPPPSPPPPP